MKRVQSSNAEEVRPPGMIEVGRLAGVSAQTVSRALRGHSNVQPETRLKVLAAVEQLGYRRNNAARALSSGRSRIIGLADLQTLYYSRAAVNMGIENAAREAGYVVNVATTSSLDARLVGEAITRLADQGAEGIILTVPLGGLDQRIETLLSSLPTITLDGSQRSTEEGVAIDQASAGRMATEHLLTLGHKTVWHVSGPEAWIDATSRTAGWRSALQSAGVPIPPELHGDWSPESGYRNGLIIGRIPEATAIFVASDEMAFGVIRALHEVGRRVPDDVSVVSVDNIALAAYSSPPLTTIDQPFVGMGQRAVAHLLRKINDPTSTPELEMVEPKLIVRASTAAPPRV